MARPSSDDKDFLLRHEFGNAEANLHFLDAVGGLETGGRWLEIGCGRGGLLKHLVDLGIDATGVEVSAERIQESVALYGPLPVHKVEGSTLPFPDASFETVLSFDVFEHIAASDAHLAEVRRVLVPGGRYLLQTPNKWTNTVFETMRWKSLTSWRAEHCSLHTYGQLQRRLTRHGFTVTFHDTPVVTDFFRRKVAHHLGSVGLLLIRLIKPDRLPLRLRTNFYVEARLNTVCPATTAPTPALDLSTAD